MYYSGNRDAIGKKIVIQRTALLSFTKNLDSLITMQFELWPNTLNIIIQMYRRIIKSNHTIPFDAVSIRAIGCHVSHRMRYTISSICPEPNVFYLCVRALCPYWQTKEIEFIFSIRHQKKPLTQRCICMFKCVPGDKWELSNVNQNKQANITCVAQAAADTFIL